MRDKMLRNFTKLQSSDEILRTDVKPSDKFEVEREHRLSVALFRLTLSEEEDKDKANKAKAADEAKVGAAPAGSRARDGGNSSREELLATNLADTAEGVDTIDDGGVTSKSRPACQRGRSVLGLAGGTSTTRRGSASLDIGALMDSMHRETLSAISALRSEVGDLRRRMDSHLGASPAAAPVMHRTSEEDPMCA